MNEKLNYRSHTIELELMEIRPQRFRWLYIIDSTRLYTSNDVLQPMQQARTDALAMAFGEINALEVIATTIRHTVRHAAAAATSAVPSRSQRPDPGNGNGSTTGCSEEARRVVARRSLQAERDGSGFKRDPLRAEEPSG